MTMLLVFGTKCGDGTMTRIRLVCLRLTVLFCLALCTTANGEEYADHVKASYQNIFISKIVSASTVQTRNGYECFYKYDSQVINIVRGY
jgi:hypothetical protein